MKCDIRDNMPKGKLSFVIFVDKCNMKCKNCDRSWQKDLPDYTCKRFLEAIPYVDCVAISGGEPTLYPTEVKEIITKSKEHGKEVVLYTNLLENDTFESMLRHVDHVYVDVKGDSTQTVKNYTGLSEENSRLLLVAYLAQGYEDKITFRYPEHLAKSWLKKYTKSHEDYIMEKIL